MYRRLQEVDELFTDVFGVKVEFDYTLPNSDANLVNVAEFLDERVNINNTLPLNIKALGRIIEHAVELAEDKTKITAQFGRLNKLLIEANCYINQFLR